MRLLALLCIVFPRLVFAQAQRPGGSGGITLAGTAAANRVALCNDSSCNLTTSTKITFDGTNLGLATSSKLSLNGSTLTAYVIWDGSNLHIASAGGNIQLDNSLVSGANLAVTGTSSLQGATTTIGNTGSNTKNWVVITPGATGGFTNNFLCTSFSGSGDANVGCDFTFKGAGTLTVASDPAVAVHNAQSTAAQSMEYGKSAATANALAVTFAAAFSAAPSCTCADNNATPAACGISTAATTSGVTFKGTTGATDNISWICVGLR